MNWICYAQQWLARMIESPRHWMGTQLHWSCKAVENPCEAQKNV